MSDPRHAVFSRRVFDLLREVYGVDGAVSGTSDVDISYEGAEISTEPARYKGVGKWIRGQDETVQWQVTLRFATVNTSITQLTRDNL